MRDLIAEFMNFNRPFAQRNPDLLRVKVARMAESPFAFFRGTFHVFARDVLDNLSEAAPLFLTGGGAEIDLVGDIHSENYGTYKATDDAIHYYINDFDETTRGRAGFDVCRLTTSLLLAARERGDPLEKAVVVALAAATAYAETLPRIFKKGGDVEYSSNASSPDDCRAVSDLIRTAAAAKRSDFIGRLTEKDNGQRRLKRSPHYFNLPEGERAQALRLLEDYCRRMPAPSTPDFYEIHDVCGRVAGIGSMGRLRYAVLLAGKGTKDARNVLIEFKEALPSAYDVYRQRDTELAALVGRAERVITMQRCSQVASSPYLGFAVDGAQSFQAREIGPQDSRVDFKTLNNSAELEKLAQVQGSILARTHARAITRAVGLTNPLADLENREAFCQRVLAFALAYADLVQRDWSRFVGARAELEKCEQWPTGS
ncbi:MAG TPA: DUF2252 family protein [Gemmataceae bacterium]|nr:DUF2252 family protein [Gemmataceae bacterium]